MKPVEEELPSQGGKGIPWERIPKDSWKELPFAVMGGRKVGCHYRQILDFVKGRQLSTVAFCFFSKYKVRSLVRVEERRNFRKRELSGRQGCRQDGTAYWKGTPIYLLPGCPPSKYKKWERTRLNSFRFWVLIKVKRGREERQGCKCLSRQWLNRWTTFSEKR